MFNFNSYNKIKKFDNYENLSLYMSTKKFNNVKFNGLFSKYSIENMANDNKNKIIRIYEYKNGFD